MSEIADFLRRQSEQQQASTIGAAQVVLGSVETKPDEVAADLNLADTFSKTTGNPAPPLPMVSEYRGVFAQAVERAQNNTILSKAPVLSDWLRDPKNAALAKDTLPELSWWESGWQASTGAVSRGVMRLPQSYNQWLAQGAAQRAGDQSLGFGALLSDEMAIRDQSGQIIPQTMAIPGPDDVWNASMRFLTSRLSGAVGSDQQQQAQFYQQQAGEIAKRIAAIPMSEGGERFKQVFGTLGKSGDVMADLGQFATSVAADPAGFLSFITETAVESAPSIAAATAATVVTRNPVAGATVLGTYSGAIEMGTAPVEFFQEKGIDVSTPEGAMRVISDPALMREAANRGVIRGLIIGAMDGLSGGIAGKALASSPLGNVALQAVTQAAMGAAGEAGAQIASGQQFNIAEVILEGLAEFVTAPIEVAGVGGRVFVDGQRKAADAEARKVMFEQLSGQASSSVLRARMPAAFQDFVSRATANGPVENVYVPADQFVTYFQGIGVDPNEIVSELGLSRDDLDVALAGGGDLQIPTATYAAKIAGSEHDAFLMENMRFDPDEFTSAEAADFNAKAQDAMQEAWEVAETLRVEQEELRTFEQEIYDTMVSRLRTAGRSTDVATTEALLYPAFYRVMAERSNMAVDEFMARYPLPKVEGSLPEGMQFRDVDALNRTLAEARARKTAGLTKRGPSLLEFISDRGGMIDPGGELRARDAETIRRGKGKKTLRLARGGVLTGMADLLGGNSGGAKYGVDAVAQAAIEAGYLVNDPVVQEYQNAVREGREIPDITRPLWDAIDRELRGEGEYVSNAQADAADEQTAALDQIEAYLNEIGVSLDQDDAAIKAAIEADQAGRQYAQDRGIDLTPGGGAKEYRSGDTVIDYGVSRDGQTAEVILVKTAKGARGQGSARRALGELLNAFDAAGITAFLTAEPMDKGVTKAGLVEFYKSLGFRENKGRNKDFRSQAAMVREPRTEGPLLFQQNRGSIQFPGGGVGNGDTIIRLFENADLSTTIHESGHYFLTVMQDLAQRGESAAVEDYGAVKDWWQENAADVARDGMRVMGDVKLTADDVLLALNNGTTGDVMKDAAIDVGMQEQFARGFEAYLMEGKAPSAELRGAFEKFRAWLISIYQRLAGLNVNLSPGVREVFDRMIASDAEIAKAKAESGDTGPVFATAETMGLTPEEHAAFLKLRSQGEDDAKARLMREAMAPVKRAQEKWFKDERAKVRTEVERNINASPVFRAMEWMGNRRWLGDGKPEEMPDIRLSKDILVERYGEGVLKTLPRGKQTVYAVEGGIDPDDAAGWFGFDSGDQMIRSMERAPNWKEAIEAETNKMMRDRHGDVLNDGRIEAEALDAVHTDKRGQWLAAELKSINEVAGLDVGLTAKEARETARQTIARMQVRDAMNANRFLSAERKAGEQAARLGAMLAREGIWMQNARRRIATKARDVIREDGTADAVAGQIDQANRSTGNYNETVVAVAEAKRRQLLNHALYMEARKVADEVEKAERFVAKLGKATHREKIAGAGRRENAQVDYLGAIDDLLERYDFRKSSGTADQRRGALAAFIETIKAQGRENELAIPEAVLADAARRPYKTLPVEELRGVVDSLKNLEHMALRWDKLIDAQQQRELEAVVDDITAAFDANLPKRPPGRVRGVGEGARNITRQFFDLVLNATTLLREIDGFKDDGAAYRNIKSPIDDAMSRLIGRKEKAAADLEGLYSVYTDEERRDMAVRKHMPELGYALSKWERIAVALNTGNAGNYQRLTDKRVRGALNDAQVAAVLASLDERDAAFVQSVWDYVGSFRADIAARERRTTGVEPAWVDPSPVVIAGKTLRGGYYPLKYDPRLSSLARDDQANEIAQSLQAGRFGKAQTRNGHTKERAQSSGRDIELDMSVLHRHVNQVIYDLELSEPVANSWRILQNARVRSAFIDAGKQADFDALEIWLKDVAEGELKSADLVGRAARTLKSNFTAAKLALNLGTVMMQVTGIAQSAVVVGKKNMAIGVQQSFRAGIGDEIAAKSDFMRTRQTTFNKDIFDFYNDPLMGPALSRWGEFKQKWVGPLSFWLMTKVQWYAADIPTWLAGYHQGLAKFGNDEAKAIAHADTIVKRAQASGLFSDRSAVERGSVSRNARQNDVVRLFTALGSYMFAKFNVAYERSAVAGRTIAQEGVSVRSAQEALSWTVDMAFLFTLEAVLMEVIKGFLTGLGKDDDDEKEDKNWAEFAAKQTALGVMGTIPFVRDLAGPLQGFSGGGAYGAITGELTRPMQQIMQGDVDAALVKSVISATGVATGLPATQINRAVDAAWRQVEGEQVAPLEYLLGKSRN